MSTGVRIPYPPTQLVKKVLEDFFDCASPAKHFAFGKKVRVRSFRCSSFQTRCLRRRVCFFAFLPRRPAPQGRSNPLPCGKSRRGSMGKTQRCRLTRIAQKGRFRHETVSVTPLSAVGRADSCAAGSDVAVTVPDGVISLSSFTLACEHAPNIRHEHTIIAMKTFS